MKKVIFVRGNSFENYIGSTDIEIAFALTSRYEVSILAKSKKFILGERILNGAHVLECFRVNIPLLGAVLFNISAFMTMKKHKFDILITNFNLCIASFMYKIYYPNSLIIVDIRSIPVDGSKFRVWINNMQLKYSLRSNKISGITIITKLMKEYLIKKNIINPKLPIECWGSGVNKSLFKPHTVELNIYKDLVKDSTVIIYHGTMSQSRGISNLIKAIDLLVKDGFLKIKLLLVGGGIDLNHFKGEVEELNLTDYVVFTGIVPYSKVPDIMTLADLAIVPLPDLEWWRYQSPLKIFENLSMGIPIIATDIPAHRNISNSILLIPDDKPDTIKKSIIKFIQMDKNDILNLKETAIQDSEKYTWEKQADILSNFLEHIILSNTDK